MVIYINICMKISIYLYVYTYLLPIVQGFSDLPRAVPSAREQGARLGDDQCVSETTRYRQNPRACNMSIL